MMPLILPDSVDHDDGFHTRVRYGIAHSQVRLLFASSPLRTHRIVPHEFGLSPGRASAAVGLGHLTLWCSGLSRGFYDGLLSAHLDLAHRVRGLIGAPACFFFVLTVKLIPRPLYAYYYIQSHECSPRTRAGDASSPDHSFICSMFRDCGGVFCQCRFQHGHTTQYWPRRSW